VKSIQQGQIDPAGDAPRRQTLISMTLPGTAASRTGWPSGPVKDTEGRLCAGSIKVNCPLPVRKSGGLSMGRARPHLAVTEAETMPTNGARSARRVRGRPQ